MRLWAALLAVCAAVASLAAGGPIVPDTPVWLRVYVDLDNAPTSATFTWTEITDYVIGNVEMSRGAQASVGTVQPGSGSLTLDNSDRRFDPSNTAGPYYGDLKPRRRILVQATDGSTTTSVAFGVVDGWPQSFDGGQVDRVRLRWADLLTILARVPIPDYYRWLLYDSGTIPAPRTDHRFGEVGGTVARDSSGNGLDGQYIQHPPGSTPVEWRGAADAMAAPIPPSVGGASLDLLAAFDAAEHQAGGASLRRGVQLPWTARLNGDEWTLSMWVDVDRAAGDPAGFPTLSYPMTLFIQGPLFQPVDGTVPQSQLFLTVGSSGVVAAEFTDPTGSFSNEVSSLYAPGGARYVWDPDTGDGSPAHIVLTRDGADIALYLDGDLVEANMVGVSNWQPNDSGSPIIGGTLGQWSIFPQDDWRPLGRIGEVVTWDTPLSDVQIAAIYSAGAAALDGELPGERVDTITGTVLDLPFSTLSDYGTTILGPARLSDFDDALTYLRAVAAGDGGLFFSSGGGVLTFHSGAHLETATRSLVAQLVLTDAPDETYQTGTVIEYEPPLDYEHDDVGLITELEVQWRAGSIVVTDPAATADYGVIRSSITTDLATAEEARVRGAAILARASTPALRPSVACMPVTAAATMALARTEISDRVHLVRHPPGGGDPISTYHHVEHIRHRLDSGAGAWVTSLTLGPAIAEGVEFERSVFGTAEFGTVDQFETGSP